MYLPISLTEPVLKVACLECGKEYEYDPFAGWGCLILTDERNPPMVIRGVWCSPACLGHWLEKPRAKESMALE